MLTIWVRRPKRWTYPLTWVMGVHVVGCVFHWIANTGLCVQALSAALHCTVRELCHRKCRLTVRSAVVNALCDTGSASCDSKRLTLLRRKERRENHKTLRCDFNSSLSVKRQITPYKFTEKSNSSHNEKTLVWREKNSLLTGRNL